MVEKTNLYDELEALSSTKLGDRRKLARFLEHSEDTVRLFALEKLAEKNDALLTQALSRSFGDSYAVVRMEALEWLMEYGIGPFEKEVVAALSDKNLHVRARAASLLGRLLDPRMRELVRSFAKHARAQAKIAAEAALYESEGTASRLDAVIRHLKAKDYRVRCFAANTLSDLANDSNRQYIVAALENALQHETTVAAGSTMKNVLAFVKDSR